MSSQDRFLKIIYK